jgi:MFS family permease
MRQRRGPGDLSVRLAIGLAFADASVVVLALPQIVVRLHTSISHVTWVITVYNLALIATTVAIVPVARQLASKWALVTGLAVFGVASLGSGAATDLTQLIVWRCVQGVGGGLLLCSSLPLLASAEGNGRSTLHEWATTAAFGAGVGPAIGGLLTQAFDWRAIFYAQAPVAAAAAVSALAGPLRARPGHADRDESAGPRSLPPVFANIGLAFVSAGLIGALFLATVLLINVWQVSPAGAAAILSVIPLATAIVGRLARNLPPAEAGGAGAVVLAAGLVVLALIPDRKLGLALVALGLCGIGLGLAFPALTQAALQSGGPPVARAARTVASREGGLVLGLVLLTPVLVNQLNGAPARATPPIATAIFFSPTSLPLKEQLGAGLEAASAKAPDSQLPDIGPPFAHAAEGADAATRHVLVKLRHEVAGLIQRAVTRSFRTPLLLCAVLSLLAIPPLAYGRHQARGRRRTLQPRQPRA